jgi:predicted metal-dependent phosphoesterase TrpH
MIATRALAAGLLAVAFVAGGLSDRLPSNPPRMIGGYHILATDFHVHTFPQTWSTLSPWDAVLEAEWQGLDAIAIVPHDQVWASKVGQWFTGLVDGPIVLTGEEITTRGYHMLAVGITDRIATDLSAADAIAEVHRQGGVAIVAHPYRWSWPAFDAPALAQLDGAEVVRPETPHSDQLASELREFFGRGTFAAIGSSDYHGLGLMGYARTLVFARERTAAGVVEAVRAHRTIAYDRGTAYGDAELIKLASQAGGLDPGYPVSPVPGTGRLISRIAGVLGLFAALFAGRRRVRPVTSMSGH